VPFGLAWDDAPVDLSFLYEGERPAGKHGKVRVDGRRLVFADGTRARFWGTEMDGIANFPTHREGEMVADRLAKFGVNLVRTSGIDDGSSVPNLFESNWARARPDTRSFDPDSLDRFDRFVAHLKERGIYVYLDMHTFRQFLPGDEVDGVDQLPRGARPYVYFDRRLIELQKELNANLWGHVNPYTGLAYKDDPVVVLTTLHNESDLFQRPAVLEPYRSRLESRYRAWADANDVALGADPVDFTQPDPDMARFFGEVHVEFYEEMIAHLRTIGMTIPVAGTNWSRHLGLLEAQMAGDFVDDHLYWNFPYWDWKRGTDTTPMVASVKTTFEQGVFHRSLDRPFVVSEWGHCWPDEWRAESPVAYAALASFQGWSALVNASYRSGVGGPIDRLGGGATAYAGLSDYKYFDTFNDPAIYGLMYHAALLFRRGDVREGTTTVAIEVPDDAAGAWRLWRRRDVPAIQFLAERYVAGMSLPGHRVDADRTIAPGDVPDELTTDEVRSETGEQGRNWRKGWGWVDTPRTKVAYGFLGGAGRIELDGLELAIDTDFGTVAVSSLSDEPTTTSTSLLLTAVGRCDNTDARYDAEHRWQLDPGRAPILVEAIQGEVRLRTDRVLRVLMVGECGEGLCWMPTTVEDGWLRFRIGLAPDLTAAQLQAKWAAESSIYYLIRP
jgi:hypothetical protein